MAYEPRREPTKAEKLIQALAAFIEAGDAVESSVQPEMGTYFTTGETRRTVTFVIEDARGFDTIYRVLHG